jgi:hypothetical protein
MHFETFHPERSSEVIPLIQNIPTIVMFDVVFKTQSSTPERSVKSGVL